MLVVLLIEDTETGVIEQCRSWSLRMFIWRFRCSHVGKADCMDEWIENNNPSSYRQLRCKGTFETGRRKGQWTVKLSTVPGTLNLNPADIGTKRLPCNRLKSFMSVLGMFNLATGTVEGAEDPGNLFRKKQHILSVLSVWAYWTWRDATRTCLSLRTLHLVWWRSHCFLDFCVCLHGYGCVESVLNLQLQLNQMQNQKRQQIATVWTTTLMLALQKCPRAPQIFQQQHDRHEPIQHSLHCYTNWMIERCARRRDGTEDHNRRRLYEERVTILHGLKAALNCDVEGFRVGVRRTLANMSDISDDENSPSYRDISRPTSLSDAQLAYNFVRSLQAGTEAHTGFSTNVDMVANALGQGDAWPPENLDMTSDQSSDEHMETRSEVKQRYMVSSQSEVSDPDLWVLLHYGEDSESESRTNDWMEALSDLSIFALMFILSHERSTWALCGMRRLSLRIMRISVGVMTFTLRKLESFNSKARPKL